MKKIFVLALLLVHIGSCKLMPKNQSSGRPNRRLARMLNNYYEQYLRLFPLDATENGDNRYNDLLPIDFTETYRNTVHNFYSHYLDTLTRFNRHELNEEDRLSYDVFQFKNQTGLKELEYPGNLIPFTQLDGLHLKMGLLGSGDGNQPFHTIKDYEDWLIRAGRFGEWADSAITYFKKGIRENIVLPHSLAIKIIPELDAMITDSVSNSIFYEPVRKMPATFSSSEKDELTKKYVLLITENIIPAYRKLSLFIKNEYLPKTRKTDGFGSLPGGRDWYKYLVYANTTTNETTDEIYQTGITEVARISKQMDSVKNALGFKESLDSLFNYMKTSSRFTPYKTPQEVLAAFESIHQRVNVVVKKLFNRVPAMKFEIRQTEDFRAATSSAEYMVGTADGSRPGIFYVPILDANKFNTSSGMESLFLHEAIPGHHFQLSLQIEDSLLPKFRRFDGQTAYTEGWALYCESLGKELGFYADPYQYLGALGDEMHRAVRLVVDVAIHDKAMSREEAIKYMMSKEAISEEEATSEIERYMADPGQALSYKIGALKIAELRKRSETALGEKFSLPQFHDEILKHGSLPLEVLEKQIDHWISGKADRY